MFSTHQDLNHSPLEPKASVLLMSYADPFNTKYFPEDHTKREYIIERERVLKYTETFFHFHLNVMS